MDDALVMGGLERFGQLTRNGQRFDEWKRAVRDPIRQRDAFDQFEHQRLPPARLFKSIDSRDVRMVERRQHLRFAPESRQAVRIELEGTREHLQRHVAIQFAVSCAEHLSHPACAQQSDDAIWSHCGAPGRQRPGSSLVVRLGNLGEGIGQWRLPRMAVDR